jgi:hypothetical protein
MIYQLKTDGANDPSLSQKRWHSWQRYFRATPNRLNIHRNIATFITIAITAQMANAFN